jgi:hypothetical protein
LAKTLISYFSCVIVFKRYLVPPLSAATCLHLFVASLSSTGGGRSKTRGAFVCTYWCKLTRLNKALRHRSRHRSPVRGVGSGGGRSWSLTKNSWEVREVRHSSKCNGCCCCCCCCRRSCFPPSHLPNEYARRHGQMRLAVRWRYGGGGNPPGPHWRSSLHSHRQARAPSGRPPRQGLGPTLPFPHQIKKLAS